VYRLNPEALQRAQVVGIADFAAQFFKDLPVPVASGDTVRLRQVLSQIGLHPIIIDERVIDVE
jgi:hypothetical protein